jgi:uncharacterized protein (DUF433 family)
VRIAAALALSGHELDGHELDGHDWDGHDIDGPVGSGYRSHMDYSHLITIEPDKRSGKPCIRGLRMTVQDVLEYLASGMSVDEILADFPDLTAEDIHACLAFAADRERKLWVIPAA